MLFQLVGFFIWQWVRKMAIGVRTVENVPIMDGVMGCFPPHLSDPVDHLAFILFSTGYQEALSVGNLKGTQNLNCLILVLAELLSLRTTAMPFPFSFELRTSQEIGP